MAGRPESDAENEVGLNVLALGSGWIRGGTMCGEAIVGCIVAVDAATERMVKTVERDGDIPRCDQPRRGRSTSESANAGAQGKKEARVHCQV